MVKAFQFAQTPYIKFGNGSIAELPALAKNYGNDILLVTGAGSFIHSLAGEYLLHTFEMTGVHFHHIMVMREPSPELIDQTVIRFADANIRLVIAIGGGSAIDAGKAISAMLGLKESVKEFLEGVGTKDHPGTKVPFIAVPTTSGTGSEATKNAVISEIGPWGFKKSLRHNNFVPDIAIVDPELMLQCPPDITANSGMDCFTQLAEAYVSTKSTPVTDALALDAIGKIKNSLIAAWRMGHNLEARTGMAYAALISGISIANAGLGAVHGFASSIGGLFIVPHGVVCGTLMASANAVTVKRLKEQATANSALGKYADLGKLFTENEQKSDTYYVDYFIDVLREWTDTMNISRLGKFGIQQSDIERIVSITDIKNNPVKLSKDDLIEILESRL